MNEHGSFIAALLDSSRKAFAAGAVLRLQEAGPEAARFVESWGFSSLVEDAQVRLQNLAEALACGRTELFVMDVEWLMTTYAARQVPSELLESTLSCLGAELQESLPADAASTVAAYIQAGMARLGRPLEANIEPMNGGAPHSELALRFLAALLEGKRSEAEAVVFGAIDQGIGFGDLHHYVITRAQSEVGRMWQRGEVHIAEEHLGSRIVEDVLALVRARTEKDPVTGCTVLTASVAGNLHDIGARIVADQFEMCGWRSVFLGANTPPEDIVRAVRDHEPDLVALSVGVTNNIRAAAAAVDSLRAESETRPILVGGQPFARIPDLWKDVGADAGALDAQQAVDAGARLLGLPKA